MNKIEISRDGLGSTHAGRFDRSWRARAGLVLLGVVFALLVTEVALRFISIGLDDDFSVPDLQRGWSLRPNFSGWTAEENTVYVYINSDGLRDREHSMAKSADTVRLAVLGDSYMEAKNVALDKTFSSFLEGNLNACLEPKGKRAEIINFGVDGYGTAQELLTFRHHAVNYSPDVVLLAFYTNNDVYNNSRPLNPASYFDLSPYFVFQGDRLVLDDSFLRVVTPDAQQPWFRRMRIAVTSRSFTARLLYRIWGNLRSHRPLPNRVAEPGIGDLENLKGKIYLPPAITQINEAWRVTEELLLILNREVRAHGAELWIVTLSNPPQVNPDLAEREKFRQGLGVDSLFYPDLRIRDFAGKNDIRVISLAPSLAEYTATHKVFINGGYSPRRPLGTGHWNETGNRVAAEIVGAQLCSSSPAISGLLQVIPRQDERKP